MTTEETLHRIASGTETRTRTAGAWLGIGSLLLIAGIALHPPPSPDSEAFMATIAEGPTLWMAAHIATAIGLSMVAVAGLIVLTAGSRLTEHWWTISAWGVLVVAAMLVTTAALAEATVITRASVAGDVATFEAWQPFAEAYSAAFLFVALAVAAIAGNEARVGHVTTPVWASWTGAGAGIVAAVAFVLGLGVGVAAASLVWLVATIVMSVWTLWFGVDLVRLRTATETPSEGAPA